MKSKNPFTKPLAVAFLSIAAAAVMGSYAVNYLQNAKYENALAAYVSRNHDVAVHSQEKVSEAFKQIYQSIRTISSLPTVKTLDRHASQMSDSDKETVQRIYDNAYNNVKVSEIYIVPADFDPNAIDPATGKSQAPLVSFDSEVAATSADGAAAQTGAPQVEDYEYALLVQQISWLKGKYPSKASIGDIAIPMVSGPEVITCDNTEFDQSHADADRKGVVMSVPFYDKQGQFAGVIAAITRSNVFRDLLPPSNFALVGPSYSYLVTSPNPGQVLLSGDYVKGGAADSGLLYSEALPITTADTEVKWSVWSGLPNSAFYEEPDVVGTSRIFGLAYAGIAAFALFLCAAVYTIHRKIFLPTREITSALRQLADGKLDVTVRHLNRSGEIGSLARAVAILKDNQAKSVRLADLEEQSKLEQDRLRHETETAAINGERRVVVSVLGTALGKLAQQDLTCRLSDELPGVYDKLQSDFNTAISLFEKVVGRIAGVTSEIDSGTQLISKTSDDLYKELSAQAASLEETAANISEVSSGLEKTARDTTQAKEMAAAASTEAQSSGEIVKQAIGAMDLMQKSSQQVGKITQVIEEIAFQTNLLALNAGVEAARAGDAGKGFAVVAQEVRVLAHRSSEAAKEISQIIGTSHEQVRKGANLVQQTGDSLNQIVQRVAKIDYLIAGIAANATQQSSTLRQLNVQVGSLDKKTQHHVSNLEDASKATGRMAQLASGLREIVSGFLVRVEKNSRKVA